jgi:hypothetical protein
MIVERYAPARDQFDDIAEALCEAMARAKIDDDREFIIDLYCRGMKHGDMMTLSDHEAARLREIGNRE